MAWLGNLNTQTCRIFTQNDFIEGATGADGIFISNGRAGGIEEEGFGNGFSGVQRGMDTPAMIAMSAIMVVIVVVVLAVTVTVFVSVFIGFGMSLMFVMSIVIIMLMLVIMVMIVAVAVAVRFAVGVLVRTFGDIQRYKRHGNDRVRAAIEYERMIASLQFMAAAPFKRHFSLKEMRVDRQHPIEIEGV